ncbi:hypothetical protein MP228_008093 [Amoeboaphelidium protococcarum]|nr:hypothetical protein MP228_008093 [Amoeboaphelidium protococcarum]
MVFKSLILAVSMYLVAVHSTTLTYQVNPGEHACFFVDIPTPPRKLSFYFSVQSGGQFDIDYRVTTPSGVVMVDGQKERQGDFVFSGSEAGEYSACFSNDMSSYTPKLVDFELQVQDDQHSLRAELPTSGAGKKVTDEQQRVLSPMEDTVYKLGATLADITRNQKYIRTRENRNMETVDSTESRIFYFSVFESLLIVGMSCLQVFVVRMFFRTTHSKGRI